MNRQPTRLGRPPGARSTKVRPPSVVAENNATDEKPKFIQPTKHSEQLAVDNIKLAQQRAHLMAIKTRMPFDDLYQVALIGLIKGCRRYDPTKINPKTNEPYKLSTIAVQFIDGAMRQYLRDRGHSSGVKFPDRWRDKASIVRKMHGEGKKADQIAEVTKLRADEVSEILEAQSTPVALDPEIKLYASSGDDGDMDDFYELSQALMIADSAHESISEADQNILDTGWNHPRRRQLATGPFWQFMQRVRRIASGLPIITEKQIDLLIEVTQEPTEVGISNTATKKRISEPKEILELAMNQLDLF